jgi:hypothetical protein
MVEVSAITYDYCTIRAMYQNPIAVTFTMLVDNEALNCYG